MRRYMPEFIAVPLAVVLLGLVFVILWAADAGLWAWLLVGALLLVALVVGAVVAARRPRGPAALEDAAGFEGGAAPRDDGIHRVLLLVDAACSAHDLEPLAARRPTEAFVVAPAVSSRLDRWTGDEQAYAGAEEHLEQTLGALRGLGLEARGHVGAHDPLQAADEALREFPADELVLALARDQGTAWLEEGVVETARERYSVPVRSLTLARAPATSADA